MNINENILFYSFSGDEGVGDGMRQAEVTNNNHPAKPSDQTVVADTEKPGAIPNHSIAM